MNPKPDKKNKPVKRVEPSLLHEVKNEEKDPYRWVVFVLFLLILFISYIFWVQG